jgi:hypothetical protein
MTRFGKYLFSHVLANSVKLVWYVSCPRALLVEMLTDAKVY